MASENATSLFEGMHAPRVWPASSESFWTAFFARFALYLGEGADPLGELTIWQPTSDSHGKCYYKPREHSSTFRLYDLDFDSIAVEPREIKDWPGINDPLPPDVGGFSPDILIRISQPVAPDHYFMIENKVTSYAYLAPNQFENYPRLAAWLMERGISFDILFLQSVGGSETLYEQAKKFQGQCWGKQFGILLWEEVLRKMQSTGFTISGIPIESWQRYTTALDSDCCQ